jgi:ribosomal protein L40E
MNAETTGVGKIRCPLCGYLQPCDDEARSFTCGYCKRKFDFTACFRCGAQQVQRHKYRKTCLRCSASLPPKGESASFTQLIGSDPAALLGDVPLQSVRLWFSGVTYLGGYPEELRISQVGSDLVIDEKGLHLQSYLFPWDQVIGVTVDGGEIAKSRVGAFLMYGVLGALLSKGTEERAYLTMHRQDGASAHFQFEDILPQVLRAKVAPVLVRVGIRFHDDPSPGAETSPAPVMAPMSVADELTKLAALRDQGILSEEEFSTQKSRLLS